MPLKDQLADDLKDAMRQGDENRKTTLRLLITAIKNAEVAAMKPLEDPEVIVVIGKQAKSVSKEEALEDLALLLWNGLQDKLKMLPRMLARRVPVGTRSLKVCGGKHGMIFNFTSEPRCLDIKCSLAYAIARLKSPRQFASG
jgi:hypothetical protein